MLRVCIIIILAFTVAAFDNTLTTGIRVHVEGLMAEDSVVSVITKDSVYKAHLNSALMACFGIAEEQEADYAIFRYHGISIPIYIEPGKNFGIFMKIKDWHADVRFTGKGARKNEYLNHKVLRDFYPDYKTDEEGIFKTLEAGEQQLSDVLDSMHFEPSFNSLEKKRIHYLVYAYLTAYPSFQIYQLKNEEYKPSEKFYEQLKLLIPEEEQLLEMPEYQTAMMNLLQAFGLKGLQERSEWGYLENQLNYIEKNINSQLIKDFLMDKIVTRYVEKNGTDHLEEIVRFYHNNVQDPDKKLKFDELCGKWLKLVKGQPSPVFKCRNIEGKEVSLTDLAGKYVYIDIWATWCRPCRNEFLYLEQLVRKYENRNIYFVSLSCDQDEKAWERVVRGEQLGGIQLYGGKKNDFINACVVRNIPRFILLDKQGYIIEADMTRPSDPETTKILDGLDGI